MSLNHTFVVTLGVYYIPKGNSPLEVAGLTGTLPAAWLLYQDLQIEPGPQRNIQLSYNRQPEKNHLK